MKFRWHNLFNIIFCLIVQTSIEEFGPISKVCRSRQQMPHILHFNLSHSFVVWNQTCNFIVKITITYTKVISTKCMCQMIIANVKVNVTIFKFSCVCLQAHEANVHLPSFNYCSNIIFFLWNTWIDKLFQNRINDRMIINWLEVLIWSFFFINSRNIHNDCPLLPLEGIVDTVCVKDMHQKSKTYH